MTTAPFKENVMQHFYHKELFTDTGGVSIAGGVVVLYFLLKLEVGGKYEP